MGVVVLVALTVVVGSSDDLSQSQLATFLRLDQRDMLAQRAEIWTANGAFWTEHPIVGVGLGNEASMSGVVKRSHSAYLSTVNEGGLPALLCLLLSLLAIGRRCWIVARRHPSAELRLLGVTALALLVGSAVLGIVETTLINAASTANTFLWIATATAVLASRQRVPRPARARITQPRPLRDVRRVALAAAAAR